ncbi:hypothetical protein SeMB42_g05500 [Synchytrium endobioticum]|uniref:Uncharacterized protein n=1 Tax=Synchytrium endobioticum TaxID=286115 RepID=A0A507CR20_9FUNG|nr:hypothetical protein SeMB42_g05500 [Synchytrium endobioticum]
MSFQLDSLLTIASEEVALEGEYGCNLARLWALIGDRQWRAQPSLQRHSLTAAHSTSNASSSTPTHTPQFKGPETPSPAGAASSPTMIAAISSGVVGASVAAGLLIRRARSQQRLEQVFASPGPTGINFSHNPLYAGANNVHENRIYVPPVETNQSASANLLHLGENWSCKIDLE